LKFDWDLSGRETAISLMSHQLPQGSPVAAPIAMSVAGRKYHYLLGGSSHIEVAIFLLDPWCYRSPLRGLGAPALHAYGFSRSPRKST